MRAIAFNCTSSALVLAMHSIEVNNLVRHGSTEPLQELQRQLVADQLLFANANSEVGIGGDVGRSKCALETDGGTLRLTKDALAISCNTAFAELGVDKVGGSALAAEAKLFGLGNECSQGAQPDGGVTEPVGSAELRSRRNSEGSRNPGCPTPPAKLLRPEKVRRLILGGSTGIVLGPGRARPGRSAGEGADLDQVVAEYPVPAPDRSSLVAVQPGTVPAVSALEVGDPAFGTRAGSQLVCAQDRACP